MEEFLSILTFRNVIDVLLVIAIAFYAYRLLRRSGAVNLFWGLFIFVAVWFLTGYVFHLELTGALFNQIISVGAFALIVIFQNEIRAFFYKVGSHMEKGFLFGRLLPQQQTTRIVNQLVKALKDMSRDKTGALIVVTNRQDLSEYAESGELLDAALSARLIENIFFKNSPLHDGALFITKGRLRSAACILPVSTNKDIPLHYGLRHRAALGLTETTDATALVVSEETGTISIALGDKIRSLSESELQETLTQLFAAM
ncbi:MAG: diadenylate cyclase CdaA [Paludibacteraceae bacterium]|nr:diadenylate cyclase CdaA [Paludibacteraceae bacterium]